MVRALQNSLLRRPSIAVAVCCIFVLALFAWRGDLRVETGDYANGGAGPGGAQHQPVVVRRSDSKPQAAPALVARTGRVFDSTGFLLVGADVVAGAGAARRTDADGSFTVDLPQDRPGELLIRAEGCRSEWLRVSAASPDPLSVCLAPSAPWDAAPEPLAPLPDLRGEGLVRDADGKPLPFAYVNVLGSSCWGHADDIGRVVLPLPSATATFVVHRPALPGSLVSIASVSAPFVASRARGIVPLPELFGEVGGSIRGLVRDGRGKAIVGLPIEVRGAGCRRRTETGAGGMFVLSGLLPADYEVEPFPYRGSVGEAVTVRVDRAQVACDLELARLEEAVVRIVDEAGAVAPGVWVAAILHGLRRAVVQADDQGLVHLPIAAATEFEVRTAGNHANCAVRQFDTDAEPATLVIAQP